MAPPADRGTAAAPLASPATGFPFAALLTTVATIVAGSLVMRSVARRHATADLG